MSTESERPLEQACDWLSKLHSGEFSAIEQRQLTAWRAADPAHDLAWQQAQALWQGMGGLRGRTIPGSEPLLQERYRKPHLYSIRARIAAFVPLSLRERAGVRGFKKAQFMTVSRIHHTAQPRYRRLPAVACSAVLAVSLAAFYLPAWLQADYSTGKGEQRTVTLADGSRVTLNTSTALAVHFDDSVRRVELLQGEAFFEVAKREHQPFVVTAEDSEVRAVGTAFDVQLRADQAKVELVEGIVEIQDSRHRRLERLHAGQTALIDTGNIVVQAARPSESMALWRVGYLQFDGLPLHEAVAQINQYRPGRVLLMNDRLADKRVSGLFRLDALDQAIAGLKAAVPELRTVSITPYWVVLR